MYKGDIKKGDFRKTYRLKKRKKTDRNIYKNRQIFIKIGKNIN